MPDLPGVTTNEGASEINSHDAAVVNVLNRLLLPLSHLCLATGITFSTVEEVLKRAFVQAASTLQPGAPEHGTVSRISTATGINRREVTRLTKYKAAGLPRKQPLAAEIFARWTTDPAWRDHNNVPCVLNRQGPAPSFEVLAQRVTRDVHPRSMLDELIRLGLACHNEELDLISLTRSDFVPKNDSQLMLNFLGDNVGDHLDAAVANVLHDGSTHHEQAIFADELSAESINVLRPLIIASWQALRDNIVPAIKTLIEEDRLAGRNQNQRVRIGLYSFTEAAADTGTPNNKPVSRRYRKATSKENPQ